MNVYDWDNTIYRGDSTAGFIRYCFLKRPKCLASLPRTALCGLLFGLRIMPKRTFKQNMYHMFTMIPDMEELVEEFTATHMDHVKQWYRDQQKEDDFVISASPEFLIGSFCRRLGIRYMIASPVDIRTGAYSGENCHGQEKVRRLRKLYPDAVIEEFYSDSRSDDPLAKEAAKAFLVKGDRLLPW